MSQVLLEKVKLDLRVNHNDDDAIIQIYIDAAEDEVRNYLGVSEIPTEIGSSEPPVVGSLYAAVFLLVKSKYEAANPSEIEGLRNSAEKLMDPYRSNFGV